MMRKKNIRTVIGVTLSLAIAIGGWFLTSNLIEIKLDKLIPITLHVATNTLDNTPADMTSIIPNNTEDDFTPAQSDLYENEIVSILENWDSSGRETPHEPTSEQLNMEQAIETGKEWLNFISGLHIFPDEWLHFSDARAYLFQNVLTEQNGALLPPVYSYWKVTFTNESMNINMVINAVTGQVWKTDMNTFEDNINISDDDMINTLNAFTSALAINCDEGDVLDVTMVTQATQFEACPNETMQTVDILNTDLKKENFGLFVASHDFADGNAYIVVIAIGWRVDNNVIAVDYKMLLTEQNFN